MVDLWKPQHIKPGQIQILAFTWHLFLLWQPKSTLGPFLFYRVLLEMILFLQRFIFQPQSQTVSIVTQIIYHTAKSFFDIINFYCIWLPNKTLKKWKSISLGQLYLLGPNSSWMQSNLKFQSPTTSFQLWQNKSTTHHRTESWTGQDRFYHLLIWY